MCECMSIEGSPLTCVGFQGRAEIARMLIKHGLDPFDIHKDGHTPLQRACWGSEERHTETVSVFIEAGATPIQLWECDKATSNPATKRLLSSYLKDEI